MPKRFWKGRKRLAKKYMGNSSFNLYYKHGIPKVGDLTHDCDGFNHIINKISLELWNPRPWWPTTEQRRREDWSHRRRHIRGVKIPELEVFYLDSYIDKMITGEEKFFDHPV